MPSSNVLCPCLQKENADRALAAPPWPALKSPPDRYLAPLGYREPLGSRSAEPLTSDCGLSCSQSMLEVFEAIQGRFQQIQILTRRQKDHLRRFQGGDLSSGNSASGLDLFNTLCAVLQNNYRATRRQRQQPRASLTSDPWPEKENEQINTLSCSLSI